MLIPADPVHAFVNYPDVPVPNAPHGPLAGLTFAVKDVFDVAGYPTGVGNPVKLRESGIKTKNAPLVAVALAAGARFVGKVHTAEMVLSFDGRSAHYPTPINPAAPGRVPGGSSSGSATAVADGLVDFALSSDSGGSIRTPASFCGVIGLRPTYGRIDASGCVPLAPSYDTVGWHARNIGVFERVGAVFLGEDAAGPSLSRMIVAEDSFDLLLGRVERDALAPALSAVARVLGTAERVRLSSENRLVWAEAYRTLQGFEAWQVHGPWISSRDAEIGAPTAARYAAGQAVTAGEAETARAKRAEIRARILSLLGADGVIVQPTLPGIAMRLDGTDEERIRMSAMALNCVAGHAGVPQISLPLATVDGCPLGLSLIGPPGRDRALIALARKIMEG